MIDKITNKDTITSVKKTNGQSQKPFRYNICLYGLTFGLPFILLHSCYSLEFAFIGTNTKS